MEYIDFQQDNLKKKLDGWGLKVHNKRREQLYQTQLSLMVSTRRLSVEPSPSVPIRVQL